MSCVGLFAALAILGQPHADGKAAGHFARVEVRGVLEPWTFNPLTDGRYAVRCKGNADRTLVLDFPDEARRDLAKKLMGRTVDVAGDILQRKEFNGDRPGTHTYAMAIQVKSLKEAEAPYPTSILESQRLKVITYLPDAKKAYYRGSRFDWSSNIDRIEFAGHSFFGPFKNPHNPANFEDSTGLTEEFTVPLGFEETQPGDEFIKIGVGVLRRHNKDAFGFWHNYPIVGPAPWVIATQDRSQTFRQNVGPLRGWGYELTRTVTLAEKDPSLTITRRLKNTGTKRIATEHYGHHFTLIDNEPVGPSYTMSFSFPAKLGEKFEAQDAMELRDGAIRFTKPIPANRAIFGPILGVQGLEKSEITIRNARTKAEVTIVNEQPIRRIALFGLAPVICPEPFTELALDPGQSHEWSTTYRFRTLP